MKSPWTFYIIDPFDKNITEKTQEIYNNEYKKAYDTFIESLCIPTPNDILEDGNFLFYVNCKNENDIINNDDSYQFKFLKSKFFEYKFKLTKSKLITYYNFHDIDLVDFYRDGDYYYIKLVKR